MSDQALIKGTDAYETGLKELILETRSADFLVQRCTHHRWQSVASDDSQWQASGISNHGCRAYEAAHDATLLKCHLLPAQSRPMQTWAGPNLPLYCSKPITPTGEYLPRGSLGRPEGRAGAGQHGTSGPGVLAQHSKVRSAVSTQRRHYVELC